MPKETSSNILGDQRLGHVFPDWYSILYGTCCGFLIPWTIFLAYALPQRYVSGHWSIAWVGFDCFEIILFAITALLAIHHSTWTAITSVMLGTTLIIDAWFDILTARTMKTEREAIIEAIVIEVPIAILSFVLTYRVFNYVRKQSK